MEINQLELDRKYIRQFAKISVKNVCSDLNLEKDYINIFNGTASKKKIHKVRKEIERRLEVLKENGR